MLHELCPYGIPKKKLSDIAQYKDGAAHEHIMSEKGEFVVTKVKFISSDGEYKMYSNVRLSPVEKDDIIMVMSDLPNGKSLAKCFLINESNKYTINQRVCSLTPNTDIVLPKFLYYVLNRNKQLLKYDTGHTQTHLKKDYILKVEVPIPPKEVQKVIIWELDQIKDYIKTLSLELEARIDQYEWCKHRLFNFEKSVSTSRLSNCCCLEKGKIAIQKAVPGPYPLVVTAAERKTADSYQFDRASVCIPLVSSRGHGVASLNQVFYQEGKFALGNILCGVTPTDSGKLSAKYLYYYLYHKKDILIVPLMKGGANVSVTVDALKKVKIEIPSFEIQLDIVKKLDAIIELCDALSDEIVLREIQYEFCLDKVLQRLYA